MEVIKIETPTLFLNLIDVLLLDTMKLFLCSISFVSSLIFSSTSNPLNSTIQMIRRQIETLTNIVPGIPYDGLEMIDVPFLGKKKLFKKCKRWVGSG